jgi:hypothetical protein
VPIVGTMATQDTEVRFIFCSDIPSDLEDDENFRAKIAFTCETTFLIKVGGEGTTVERNKKIVWC